MSTPPPPSAPWSTTPSPGWQPPPPPAPTRGRGWIWALVASLLAIGILAGVTLGIYLAKVTPPLDAANDYVRALAHHDYEDAFSQLCAADRAGSSPEALRSNIQRQDRLLRNLEDWSITPFDVNRDGSHASVDVDTQPDDSDEPDIYTLLMDEIDGRWQPCGGAFGFRTRFDSGEVAGARVGVGGVGQHVHE